jgi:hypothetical protein
MFHDFRQRLTRQLPIGWPASFIASIRMPNRWDALTKAPYEVQAILGVSSHQVEVFAKETEAKDRFMED